MFTASLSHEKQRACGIQAAHYRRSEEKTSQQRPIAGHAGNPMSDASTQYVLTIDPINLTQPNWDSCLLLNEHA